MKIHVSLPGVIHEHRSVASDVQTIVTYTCPYIEGLEASSYITAIY